MDIEAQLFEANSRRNADRILAYVAGDSVRVKQLMAYYFDRAAPRLAQRAAMVVGELGRLYPEQLFPYHAGLVDMAERPTHEACRRSALRYFSELNVRDILEECRGNLLAVAFEVTAQAGEPVASRVFAMQIAFNFCEPYPELRDELAGILEQQIPYAGPGYRSRGGKLLKALAAD